MTSPDERIDIALSKVTAAAGSLIHYDPQAGAVALVEAVGGLSDVYLHIDAATGEYDPGPIWQDPDRVLLADLPVTVAPLVALVADQTARVDAAIGGGDWTMPASEVAAWQRWKTRLVHYQAVLAEEKAKGPTVASKRLYREVSGPLVSGVYPAGWEPFGIHSTHGVPDAVRVAITVHQIALQHQLVSPFHQWLADSWMGEWSSSLQRWSSDVGNAIRKAFERLGDAAATGIATVGKVLVGGAVAFALVWWIRRSTANNGGNKS